jgi:hypothetical protein
MKRGGRFVYSVVLLRGKTDCVEGKYQKDEKGVSCPYLYSN